MAGNMSGKRKQTHSSTTRAYSGTEPTQKQRDEMDADEEKWLNKKGGPRERARKIREKILKNRKSIISSKKEDSSKSTTTVDGK